MTWLLVLAIGAAIGLVLGLLGGGGAILTVPALVALGEPVSAAVGTSLVVVGVTAAVGAVGHARAGHVDGRVALLFGAPSFLGAALGSRVQHGLPSELVLAAFAAVMLAAALVMLRAAPCAAVAAAPAAQRGRLALLGLAVGAVTGLVGAGGGFVMVPALSRAGLPLPRAIGTSLVLIAATCAVALASRGAAAPVDWAVAAPMASAAALASLVGARLSSRVPARPLRVAFAGLVLVTGLSLLAAQLPARAAITLPLAVVVTAGIICVSICLRRRAST